MLQVADDPTCEITNVVIELICRPGLLATQGWLLRPN